MIRAVLDTNVIISGTIKKSGPPFTVFEAWREGRFLLITSRAIIKEVERVFHYPRIKKKYSLTERQIGGVIQNLKKYTVVAPGKLEIQVIKEDLSDNRLLAAALEGKAQYIVSGDPHLKNLKRYRSVRLVSPAEFVRILSC